MTGFRSAFFRDRCSISGCYIERLPDWGDIIAQFPRGIIPTDIDGMVEINGRFLFLEEKSMPGASMSGGQQKALARLSHLPGVTVMVFRPGRHAELDVLEMNERGATGFQPCDRADFLARIGEWASRAERSVMSAHSGPAVPSPLLQ